ncbi:hypothetical protein MTR_4g100805 [Medicago truncatula]|uniref:Uncharacterized protein n=1 Tax=Medicago truncatula TaxID=3880 RepID=A0A072UPL9_MEDTR|nr:hypothetical protein MTR_4g100805 [Medicago truncatula]
MLTASWSSSPQGFFKCSDDGLYFIGKATQLLQWMIRDGLGRVSCELDCKQVVDDTLDDKIGRSNDFHFPPGCILNFLDNEMS